MVGIAITNVIRVSVRIVKFKLLLMTLENVSVMPFKMFVEIVHISSACLTSSMTSSSNSISSSYRSMIRPFLMRAAVDSTPLREVEKYTSDFSRPNMRMSSRFFIVLRNVRSNSRN